MAVRKLSLQLDLDSGRFTAGLRGADGNLRRLSHSAEGMDRSLRRMERRVNGVTGSVRDFTVILGQARAALLSIRDVTIGWVGGIVRSNAQMERMTFLLRGLSDATSDAARAAEGLENFQYLIDLAKEAPFTINALSDAFVKFESVNLENSRQGLEALSDAVAAFGGTDETLHRASIAIQQMGGKGVISMEELRQQLGEAVPSAMILLARSMDLSVRELVDQISSGTVEAQSALQKLFGEFERTFGGSSQDMMETFSGELARVKTAITEFFLEIGGRGEGDELFSDTGFMGVLKQQLSEIYFFLQTPAAAQFAREIGVGLSRAVQGFADFIRVLFEMREALALAGRAALVLMGALAARAVLTSTAVGIVAVTNSLSNMARAMPIAQRSLTNIYNTFTTTGWRMNELAVSARNLGPTMRNLGRAIGAMAGPIGIGVMALWTAADALGFFADRSEDAERAWSDFQNGVVNEGTIKALTDRASELETQINRIESTLDNGRRNYEFNPNISGDLNNPEFVPITGQQRREAIEDLSALRIEYRQLQGQIEEVSEAFAENTGAQRAATDFRSIQRELDGVRNAYRTAANDIGEARNELDADGSLTVEARSAQDAALRERRLDLVRSYYADQLAIIQREETRVSASLNNARRDENEESAQHYEQLLRMITSKREDIREAMNSALATAELPNNLLVASDAFDEEMGRITDALNEARAEADNFSDGSIASLEAYQQQLEQSGNYSVEQIGALSEKYIELVEALDRVEAQQERARALRRLGAEASKASEEIDLLRHALVNTSSSMDFETARTEARLRAMAEAGGLAAEEMSEHIGQIMTDLRASESVQFFGDLDDQIEDINDALSSNPEGARATREYQRAIQALDEYVEAYRAKFNNIDAIAEQSAQYRAALERQLQRETETPMQEMLREWKNIGEAMQEASADWLDQFVSDLARGELRMDEFVISILEDIAEMRMKAALSGFIDKVIGAVTGNFFSPEFSSPVGTPVSGKTPIGGNHSGGIAGLESSFNRSVSLANLIPKYHTGGIAGLMPNEVPAILEKGEGIFTREQMRAMGGMISAPMMPEINFNLINQSGQAVEAEKQGEARFDGEKFIVDVVLKNLNTPGRLRSAVKGVQ